MAGRLDQTGAKALDGTSTSLTAAAGWDGGGSTATSVGVTTQNDFVSTNGVYKASAGSESQLNALIVAADSAGANAGKFEIDLSNDIAFPLSGGQFSTTTPLEAINLKSGVSLDIEGQGHAIDGSAAKTVSNNVVTDGQRGLFVYSGQVSIENLTLENLVAKGGDSGFGGAGAGLGGGLFVADNTADTNAIPGNVKLTNVAFSGDAAIGGTSVGGFGGGGGLGGGGSGGGGGIGSGARGGSGGSGGSGGIGIVYGGADGGSVAEGNFTYSGGASGGGGGAFGGGAGGGVGGVNGEGGNGGFGGGGGGSSAKGGNGGFGGGGGNGGNGGFGGGGGQGGNGGFGGGQGGSGQGANGGGGLGAGGDIFVQQGASLTIAGGTTSAGTVTGGAGRKGGGNGSAYGNGIFIQGNQSVTLAAAQGQITTVAGVIADMTGSKDSSGQTGAGRLTIGDATTTNAGIVVLSGANTYTGGTTVQSGTLKLGADGAIGSGSLAVAGGATFDLGGHSQTVTNLSGTGSLVNSGSSNALTVQSGGSFGGQITSANLALAVAGGTLVLTNVGNAYTGGTTIQGGTLELGTNSAAGTGAITFASPSASLKLDASITKSATFADTLAGLAGGDTIDLAGLAYQAGASATVSGSTLTVTSGGVSESFALSNLGNVTFTAASDGAKTPGTLVTAVAVPQTPVPIPGVPVLVGGGSLATSAEAPVQPFAGASVTDPNSGATDTLTIQLSNAGAGGTLAGAGLQGGSGGTYTLSGTDAQVTAALRALVFTPIAGAPGAATTTNFTFTDQSSAGAAATAPGGSVTDTAASAPSPAPGPTPTPSPTPTPTPSPMPAGDTLAFDATSRILGHGTFELSGRAASAAGIGSVEITADVDGVATDLGAATVNPDGTFTNTDPVGPHTQTGIAATLVDGAGTRSSATAPVVLTAGIAGQPYRATEDRYDPGSGAYLGTTYALADGRTLYASTVAAAPDGGTSATYADGIYFRGKAFSSFTDSYAADGTLYAHAEANRDGSHAISVLAPGGTVAALGSDTIDATGQAATTFVFQPGFGQDLVTGFRAAGPGHDTLDLPGSDFASLAQVLRQTRDTSAGAVITDRASGDTITLAGVAKADLAAHARRDVALG